MGVGGITAGDLALRSEGSPWLSAPVRSGGAPSLHDSVYSTASSALLEVEQWAVVVGIVACIEDLNAGVVIAVERRDSSRTAGFNRVRRVGEPDPEVVGLNRRWSGVQDESFVTEN